jgi:hypothetical protein
MKSKVFKILGFVLLGFALLFVIVGAFFSPQSHVERSIVISAQPAVIFGQINSLKAAIKWMPWGEKDPKTKYTFEGPESGVGAKMSWQSEVVGNGSQWIMISEENKHLKTGMNFDMEGTYTSDIFLAPSDSGTKGTWTYDGDVSESGLATSLMGKLMGKFMDNLLGPDYEKGLSNLKKVSELEQQANEN